LTHENIFILESANLGVFAVSSEVTVKTRKRHALFSERNPEGRREPDRQTLHWYALTVGTESGILLFPFGIYEMMKIPQRQSHRGMRALPERRKSVLSADWAHAGVVCR
jgi:hypothetical protein